MWWWRLLGPALEPAETGQVHLLESVATTSLCPARYSCSGQQYGCVCGLDHVCLHGSHDVVVRRQQGQLRVQRALRHPRHITTASKSRQDEWLLNCVNSGCAEIDQAWTEFTPESLWRPAVMESATSAVTLRTRDWCDLRDRGNWKVVAVGLRTAGVTLAGG